MMPPRHRPNQQRAHSKLVKAHKALSHEDYRDDRLTEAPYVPLRILEEEADEPGINPTERLNFLERKKRAHSHSEHHHEHQLHHKRHHYPVHAALKHSNNPEDYRDDRETVIPPLSLRVLRMEADEPGIDPLEHE